MRRFPKQRNIHYFDLMIAYYTCVIYQKPLTVFNLKNKNKIYSQQESKTQTTIGAQTTQSIKKKNGK